MLTHLSVLNLAVVEKAEIDFGEGLDIITGETGAGKSVLMGALELVLGSRADVSAVRDGAKEARISAEFSLKGKTLDDVARMLVGAGLPPCEGGTLVVRRTVSATGGGRVAVNDTPATVQTLRSIGRLLADMHGPNDRQTLLEESFQRNLLDEYGRVAKEEYSAAWTKLAELRKERDALNGETGDLAVEAENLRYAVDEIGEAHLTDEDENELPARHAAAAHAADIMSAANAAIASLTEADDSAANALIAAAARLREAARYHDSAPEWVEEAESLTVQVQELSRAISDAISRMDADPETLQQLDERLSLVQRLKRKYACADVQALLALRDSRAARLAALEGREARLAAIGDEIEEATAKVVEAGRKVSASRKKAASRFAGAVTKELHGLGFMKAGFGVELVPHEPDADGCETVMFMFEPNPGESSRPLRDIASTGEIARVMLAVKSVAAEHDSIPLLVFDEIDSNIGGETGRAVGERLRAVSRHHQVIAITHLPQSAVYGDEHLAVEKTVSGGRTRTTVRRLEGDERVAEIARMLGGATLTSVVERHARELLSRAGNLV